MEGKKRYDVSENTEAFRKRFKELLNSHGYTYADVEYYTGITNATVCRYVTAQRLPAMESLLVLCKHFGVSADWLMGLDDDEKAKDVPELVSLYNRASKDDRAVIDMILSKYKK